ncbi:MAG: phosphatidylglycerophosphatase A [Gammaproteobacteria bacterium]|nr:phosphatidylglycerophosphatase A [Gammaproteobacteria bacterium]
MDLGRPQDRAPKPPAELVLTTPEHLIAFGFGAGLAPVAPGTFGTLVGVPVWLAIAFLSLPYYAAALALLILFGIWVCGESARLLGIHDCPGIVFDEIAGFCVAATPLLPALALATIPPLWGLVSAFVLFRLFDIAKPWPIRKLDQTLHGGFGIMADDLLAGAYAAAVLAGGLWVLR